MPTTSCGFDDTPEVSGSSLLESLGPTLYVAVGFDPNFRPNSRIAPALPSNGLPALVDTGAFECCIDSTLARDLNLPVVDRKNVAGAHGSGPVNYHLAQINIPALNFTMYGGFAGVHLATGGQRHLALIGRTFLRHFKMTYEGRTGTVTISND